MLEKKDIAMAKGARSDVKNRVQIGVLFKSCLEGKQNSGF